MNYSPWLFERLPWRVQCGLERLQFRSLRHVRGEKILTVRGGCASGSLVAVGDIALRDLEALIAHDGAMNLLRGVMGLLSDCDIRIGNLETVLTDEAEHDLCPDAIHAAPSTIRLLTAARFDLLSLANNHVLDCRVAGLLECRKSLDEHGIRYCGAGQSTEESRWPAIVEACGLKIGMLGYCDNSRVDINGSENVAPAGAYDEWVLSDIRKLRPRVHLLVVQLHWGWEFSFYPLLSYRDRARRFAEAGADLVLCHHAHVPSAVEVWKRSIISHGLGDFVFAPDAYLRGGHPWWNRSYALKVNFDRGGVLGAEVVPCVLSDHGLPTVADWPAAAEIAGAIARVSARLHQNEWLAWVERDRIVRETGHFFESFPRNVPPAQYWALKLRRPFQQHIIGMLRRDFGGAGERLASFMQEVAGSGGDPQLAAALSKRVADSDIARALAAVTPRRGLSIRVPGRTL